MEFKVKTNEPKKKGGKPRRDAKQKPTVQRIDLEPLSLLPQTHPCIAQYGSCVYGDTCALASFPAAACVYHLQYQLGKGCGCIYGDECFNSHIDISEYMQHPDLNDSFDKPSLNLYYQQAPKAVLQAPHMVPHVHAAYPPKTFAMPAYPPHALNHNVNHNHHVHPGPHSPTRYGNPMHTDLPSPRLNELKPSPNAKRPHLEELFQWSQIYGEKTVIFHSDSHFEVALFTDEDCNPAAQRTEVKLRITVPELYPVRLPQIEVINPELNQALVKSMNTSIAAKLKEVNRNPKEIIYNTLSWFQVNLDNLLSYRPNDDAPDADDLIENVVTAALEDVKADAAKEKEELANEHRSLVDVGDEKENNSDLENAKLNVQDDARSEEESESVEDANVDSEEGLENEKAPQVTRSLGVQILCEDVALLNVGLVECYVLRITVSCSQCKTRTDIQVTENVPFTSICTKCKQAFGSLWVPVAVHAANNKLGELELQNILLADNLPSCFRITCLNCNSIFNDKNLAIGKSHQNNCRDCHKLLSYKIERLEVKSFTMISNFDLEKTKETKGKKLKNVGDGITRGLPLPKNGSCKHYKSKRWQRFPCCHKLYPCHQCHDLDADHSAEWANRMVCGYCSVEQAMGDECSKCGKELAVVKQSTAHWEGGQGKRDVSTMSKKDNKKYRGMNKTSPSVQKK